MEEINVMERLLEENDQVAEENRRLFKEEDIFVINLVGSPGCGKTSLLEHLLKKLDREINLAVIEGDLYTSRDAERIEGIGPKVVQVNTGGACHLEASLVKEALDEINLAKINLLIIENVGNLVCPASFDLGEDIKITVLSVPEGNDKPLKYPAMFAKSEAVIVNKIDLLEETNFSLEEFYQDIKSLKENMKVFEVSCTGEEGVAEVCSYLKEKVEEK